LIHPGVSTGFTMSETGLGVTLRSGADYQLIARICRDRAIDLNEYWDDLCALFTTSAATPDQLRSLWNLLIIHHQSTLFKHLGEPCILRADPYFARTLWGQIDYMCFVPCAPEAKTIVVEGVPCAPEAKTIVAKGASRAPEAKTLIVDCVRWHRWDLFTKLGQWCKQPFVYEMVLTSFRLDPKLLTIVRNLLKAIPNRDFRILRVAQLISYPVPHRDWGQIIDAFCDAVRQDGNVIIETLRNATTIPRLRHRLFQHDHVFDIMSGWPMNVTMPATVGDVEWDTALSERVNRPIHRDIAIMALVGDGLYALPSHHPATRFFAVLDDLPYDLRVLVILRKDRKHHSTATTMPLLRRALQWVADL
jgi:hypothetical protein